MSLPRKARSNFAQTRGSPASDVRAANSEPSLPYAAMANSSSGRRTGQTMGPQRGAALRAIFGISNNWDRTSRPAAGASGAVPARSEASQSLLIMSTRVHRLLPRTRSAPPTSADPYFWSLRPCRAPRKHGPPHLPFHPHIRHGATASDTAPVHDLHDQDEILRRDPACPRSTYVHHRWRLHCRIRDGICATARGPPRNRTRSDERQASGAHLPPLPLSRTAPVNYAAPGHQGCGPTRSPPNMTKVFERWGLSDELRRRGIVCTAINMRDGASGWRVAGAHRVKG